jgi:hypothetical protein
VAGISRVFTTISGFFLTQHPNQNPGFLIPAILLGSQTLLIVFVVINRKKPAWD